MGKIAEVKIQIIKQIHEQEDGTEESSQYQDIKKTC